MGIYYIPLVLNFSITHCSIVGKILKPHGSVENSVYSNNDVCKDIKCDFDATCEVGPDGFPRCSCIFNCSADTSPVCGSDFRTYNSLCLMKLEGCQKQQELRLRPMELCQGMRSIKYSKDSLTFLADQFWKFFYFDEPTIIINDLFLLFCIYDNLNL